MIIAIFFVILQENIDMNGYRQKHFEGKTKRFVQILDLRDDPDMIKEYRKWHSEEFHWKEIREGIKAVGIIEL